MLLGYLQHTGEVPRRALDVGAGDSVFSSFLASAGIVGAVTALDLPEAFEDLSSATESLESALGVERMAGSMLDIPCPDESFDLVTCISAIEHLDGHAAAHRRDPVGNPQLPYDLYLEKARTALREMARVLRQGGLLYLTTDAYVPRLQESDAWVKYDTKGVIWSAFRLEDVQPVFLDTLEGEGVSLVGELRLDERSLTLDERHSTFRGRYFTSFSLTARKRLSE